MSTVKQFSIGGAIGIAIGLIGTGIQWLWPERRVLAVVLIVFGLTIFLIAIVAAVVRSLTIKEYERQRLDAVPLATPLPAPTQQPSQTEIAFKPNIQVNPVFNQTQSQSQEQLQTQSPRQARSSVAPEITCVDCYVIFAELLPGTNTLVENGGTRCKVAQADFHLEPILDSDPWIELRTHLEFFSPDRKRLCRVSDGVWREQLDGVIQMPFRRGDTRRLVLALEVGSELRSYEYAEKSLSRPRFTPNGPRFTTLAPRSKTLTGDKVIIHLHISGEFYQEVTLDDDFWFELARPELTVTQIEFPFKNT